MKQNHTVSSAEYERTNRSKGSGLYRNSSSGLVVNSNRDLRNLASSHSKNPQQKANIEPVLNRRKQQGVTQTGSGRRPRSFLSSDVFRPGRNQLAMSAALTQQQHQQQSQPPNEQWSSGIRKLMAKVQTMKEQGQQATTEMGNVYSEHPANFSKRAAAHSQASGHIIHKGKKMMQMSFGRTADNFANNASILRPNVDSFITSPYEKSRRQQPFSLFHPDQTTKLQLSQTTSPHMLEAVDQVNLQGATSQQFEYLVNKTFLNSDNRELEKQANRISKLNELCRKVTDDVHQLKKECRQGNFEIDPAFNEQQPHADLAKTYGSWNAQAVAANAELQKSSSKVMTPLEQVTEGINLMYASSRGEKQRARGQRLSHARSGAIKIQSDSFLPNIDQRAGQAIQDNMFVGDYNQGYRHKSRSPEADVNSTSQHADSPTTMSKSYITRGPPDTYGMAAKRTRVQSAVNMRSRQINSAAYATTQQRAMNKLGSQLQGVFEGQQPRGASGHLRTSSGQLQNGRRTQSAIFRPLSNVARSMSKLDHMSTQNLSNIRSSHFGMPPESSAAGGAPQMSPEQMIKLLSSQFEKQLSEQPNALQSEAERKQVIERTIRQLYASSNAKDPQLSPAAGGSGGQAGAQEQTRLDSLINKQQQTKLESIQENLKQASNEQDAKEENKKSQMSIIENPITSANKHESMSSIKTDNLSVVDHRVSPNLLGTQDERDAKKQHSTQAPVKKVKTQMPLAQHKSTMITVQVDDAEVDGTKMSQQVPLLRQYKSNYPGHMTSSSQIVSVKQHDFAVLKQVQQHRSLKESTSRDNKVFMHSQKSQRDDEQHLTDAALSIPTLDLKRAKSSAPRSMSQTHGKLKQKQQSSMQVVTNVDNNGFAEQSDVAMSGAGFGAKAQSSKHSRHSNQQVAIVNSDLQQVAHEIAINQQQNLFGRTGIGDEFLDDDDYAFKKERQAKIQTRKMTAVSYDTAVRASRFAGTNEIQPVLKDRPSPTKPTARTTILSLQSSARADLLLTEMYNNTIEDFKKKLYEQKQQAVLQRINQFKDQRQKSPQGKNRKAGSTPGSQNPAPKGKPQQAQKQKKQIQSKSASTQNAGHQSNQAKQILSKIMKKNRKGSQLMLDDVSNESRPTKKSGARSNRSKNGRLSPRGGDEKDETVKPSPRRRSSRGVSLIDSPRGSATDSKHGSEKAKSSIRRLSDRKSARRASEFPACKDDGLAVNSNDPSNRAIVKMHSAGAASGVENDGDQSKLASAANDISALELSGHSNQSQNSKAVLLSPVNSAIASAKHSKKSKDDDKKKKKEKKGSSMINAYKRKLAGLGVSGLHSLMGISESGVSTHQGDAGIMNLNIKTGTNSGGEKQSKQPKKTKKLLEIIKNFEEEKMKAHMTKDELEFLNLIDEFAPKEDDASTQAPSGLGPDFIKKFIPNYGADKDVKPTSRRLTSPPNPDQKSSDHAPVIRKNQGRLTLYQSMTSTKPLGVDDSMQHQVHQKLQFKRQGKVKTNVIETSATVSAKQQFFFEELDTYLDKTVGAAHEKHAKMRAFLGDFDDFDEPISMHLGVAKNESTFLSHPGQKNLYELKHGFMIDNTYRHTREVMLDGERRPEADLRTLQTRDPRLTKSLTDLHEVTPQLNNQINVAEFSSDEENRDEEASAKKRERKARKKKFLQVCPALRLDSSWFAKGQSQRQFQKLAMDDLDRSLSWKNLQFLKGHQSGTDLDKVKQAVYKNDRREREYREKILATTHGQIANLYRQECDLLVRDAIFQAKFESQIDQAFAEDIIPEIESIGQIARSKIITTEEVKEIEREFARQDAYQHNINSFLGHPDNLEFVEFEEVDENLPLDVSVEIQRIGLTRQPLKLGLTKVVEREVEAPVELLWLLKIDSLLQEAISNSYYSPFRPAPILENFRMEFNVLKINHFIKYHHSLKPVEPVDSTYDLGHYRSKLLKGMLDFFNDQVVQRLEQQTHLALRFSRPLMQRAHREELLRRGRYVKPVWEGIKTLDELQKFKRSRCMPELISARRENAMELYVSHDVGSVVNHFFEPTLSLPSFRTNVAFILSDLLSRCQDANVSIETSSSHDSDDAAANLDVFSDTSVGTSHGYLSKLRSSPDKKKLSQKRPKALKQFQKSVTRQLKPIKIRHNPTQYNAENQAILVFQQEKNVEKFIRTPIRLHEQFQHVWTFKVRVFRQPRAGQMSLDHKIIPEGQSKDDFSNQDFCFYDAIEATRTPEVTRIMQEKLRSEIEKRITQLRTKPESLDSPRAIKAKKKKSPARKSSKKRNKDLVINVTPVKSDGDETVDLRLNTGMNQEGESPCGSATKINLNKPAMRKTKAKKVPGGKKPSKKGSSTGKRKQTTTMLILNQQMSSDY